MVAGEVEAVLLAWGYRRLHCHRCLLVGAADQLGVAHHLKFRMISQ